MGTFGQNVGWSYSLSKLASRVLNSRLLNLNEIRQTVVTLDLVTHNNDIDKSTV